MSRNRVCSVCGEEICYVLEEGRVLVKDGWIHSECYRIQCEEKNIAHQAAWVGREPIVYRRVSGWFQD